MGKILVLYDTLTACTGQMAEYVAEGAKSVPGTSVRLLSVEDPDAVEAVLWADGLAVGTPTNLGGVSWKMKKFWDDFAAENWDRCDGKFGMVFSSVGSAGGGAELACMSMQIVLQNFGWLTTGVTDYVDRLHSAHYGGWVVKKPRNDYDRAVCRRTGMRLAEWVAVFVDGDSSMHPLLRSKPSAFDSRKTPAENKPDPMLAEKLSPSADTEKQLMKTPGPRCFLHVTIQVPEEAEEKFLPLIKELTVWTLREVGCITYSFARDAENPRLFYVHEQYINDTALTEHHMKSEYFNRIVPQFEALGCKTENVVKSFAAY
ncbi:Flavodoxin [Porphyridium purpureum]|uniref:Flavodoxin n=1 Tax=Porphyridium purpureum TaxID=35688 RepID=A0A5J4Z4R1_PORPP|nr:Flavodoxin [Porphyridium purpureum]|eukprot:POR2717..scf295_1